MQTCKGERYLEQDLMTAPLRDDSTQFFFSVIAHKYGNSTAVYFQESVHAFPVRSIPHGFWIIMPGFAPGM